MLGSMYDYDQVDYGLDAYVDGKFDAFGQQHELVVGANASRGKKMTSTRWRFCRSGRMCSTPINIFPNRTTATLSITRLAAGRSIR